MTCLIFNSQAFCILKHGTADIHHAYSVTHFNQQADCTATIDIYRTQFVPHFNPQIYCTATADIHRT